MSLALVRVDDRLIHGQVVAVWLKSLPARRIIVVDDRTAADPFMTEVLEAAAPPGVAVEVLGVDPAAGEIARASEAHDPAYVLVRSPLTALELVRRGVSLSGLNVGALGMAPGRRPIHRSIAASDDELDALRTLEELGVRVILQPVPDDRPIPLASAVASR